MAGTVPGPPATAPAVAVGIPASPGSPVQLAFLASTMNRATGSQILAWPQSKPEVALPEGLTKTIRFSTGEIRPHTWRDLIYGDNYSWDVTS